MFTFRMVPSRWLGERCSATPETFLDVYYRSLWTHWSPASRALALTMIGALYPVRHLPTERATRRWHLNFPRFYDDAQAQRELAGTRPEDFLWPPARKGVHRLLNPAALPFSASPLKNKHLFAERCRAAGLPQPETLAPFADGDGAERQALGWPAIIVKPNYSSRGRGVMQWRRRGDRWSGPCGESLDDAGLAALLRRARRAGAIVQRCLEGAAELLPVSPGALATLRVVTCRDERGVPEATDTILRLSAGGARPVDNFGSGGLAVVVDAGGQMGPGVQRVAGGRLIEHAVHPQTGHPIAGERFAGCAAAVALATLAHERIGAGFTVIAWDIAPTDEGPMLIEGNWNPGGDTLQLPQGTGIAARRLGALYRHHLRQLPPEAWRKAFPLQIERR